ncbi:hypothetical protein FRZ44_42390 [Hypericibacter terrae]|uniref:J domain-containing protein n=1 Tax=Hypericibacter terrae TaxID=2602015 RepID=A0A5J6MN00_9PROT|nr:J domain-containing protein [Hypericibacter terrae]QEX18928.1 hypothetical protein FRZ44_42390 [Hypericibacter terrae]
MERKITQLGNALVIEKGRYTLTNLLSDKAVTEFFDLKEKLFFFRGIGITTRKRDFTPTVLKALADFLSIDRKIRLQIYRAFGRPVPTMNKTGSLGTQLRSEWKHFDRYFGPDVPATIEEIKTRYRKAALVLHPDTGGTDEGMIQLNLAYRRIHDAILRRQISDQASSITANHEFSRESWWPGNVIEYPHTPTDFDTLLLVAAIDIAEDILAEDIYASFALELDISQILKWEQRRQIFQEESISHVIRTALTARKALGDLERYDQVECLTRRIADWIERFTELIARNHIRSAVLGRGVTSRVQMMEQILATRGAGSLLGQYWRQRLKDYQAQLQAKPTASQRRFVLNHSLQAENALRRGFISNVRYRNAIVRFHVKTTHRKEAATWLDRWLLSTGGFKSLDLDPFIADEEVMGRYVIESPGAYTSGNWLLWSADACREYGKAFYRHPTVELVAKYGRARLWLTLASVIRRRRRGWSNSHLHWLAGETGVIEKIGIAVKEGDLGKHASELKFFLEFLIRASKERKERLSILDSLGDEDFRDKVPPELFPKRHSVKSPKWRSINGFKPDPSEIDRITPSSGYYRDAMRSLEDLKSFVATGHWLKKRTP